MPSLSHEALLTLFRNRPALAPELLRDALHLSLPSFGEVRLDSADLTDIQPAEYRADLVVLLTNSAEPPAPALGIVVEVQLSRDPRKRFAWPAYVANLRARLKCPVCLLVVTADKRVARWAAKTLEMGGGNCFTPLVLGPSGVPKITDEDQARADPELAVLSAIAHGCDRDAGTSVRIAMAAQKVIEGLEEDRSKLYYDLVMRSLTEAARKALQTMDMKTFMKTYQYQSEFARRYHSQGIAEGRIAGRTEGEQCGRAAVVTQQLEMRFGPMSSETRAAVLSAPIAELDAIAKRLLTVATLREALGLSNGTD